jgi:hypothetical protein
MDTFEPDEKPLMDVKVNFSDTYDNDRLPDVEKLSFIK